MHGVGRPSPFEALFGWKRHGGQTQQARLLFGEDFAHGAGAVFGAASVGGGAPTPRECLRIKIIEIAEAASATAAVTAAREEP